MFKKSDSGLAPVLKWVGGKRQLLKVFDPLFPSEIEYYCEPFVGGGAVFLHLRPKHAMISDINGEIINLYQVIRDDVDGLIAKVSEFTNDKDCYYRVREWDRGPSYQSLSVVDRAARILYLNRTCFNGVYRVNKQGYFNVPFGRYKNPMVVDEENLHALSQYFNEADITFKVADCVTVLDEVPNNAFVYLDPPYDPVSVTASFTSYAKDGFSKDDQRRLRECCDRLHARGVKFMLSNSSTDFIRSLYSNYHIDIVKANRAINRNGDGRAPVDEVIIRNYETGGVSIMEQNDVVTQTVSKRGRSNNFDKSNPRHAVNIGLSETLYQACFDRFNGSNLSMSAGIAGVLEQFVEGKSNLPSVTNGSYEPENQYVSLLREVKKVLDAAKEVDIMISTDQAIQIALAMQKTTKKITW